MNNLEKIRLIQRLCVETGPASNKFLYSLCDNELFSNKYDYLVWKKNDIETIENNTNKSATLKIINNETINVIDPGSFDQKTLNEIISELLQWINEKY